MTTLADARTLLSRYAGAGNDFEDRLNLAIERIRKAGNWRETKQRLILNVFPDATYNAVITLPRAFNTILAGVYLHTTSQGTRCGAPIPVQNGWYSFSPNGPGYSTDSRYNWGKGFVPEEGRYTTFADWTTSVKLRFKFDTGENTTGSINVRGNFDGQPVYTGTGDNRIQGENLTLSGATTLTTTSNFDEAPYEVVKPVTDGRVYMYTWDGVTETLVAIYEPTETSPAWRRYRVPGCSQWTEADPGQFLAICKLEYYPVYNDNDPIIPGNIGALRFGLEALLVEDSQDPTRAETLWGKAYDLLAKESEDDTGAGSVDPVQVADSFMLNRRYSYGRY